jgi:biotin carboxyl carrier protein
MINNIPRPSKTGKVVAKPHGGQSNLIPGSKTVLLRASGARNDIQVTGLPSDYKVSERILAPIPGVVTQVFVSAGDAVKAGDALLVVEAMKSKNTFRCGHNLQVAVVHVQPGEVVQAGQLLVEFGVSEK